MGPAAGAGRARGAPATTPVIAAGTAPPLKSGFPRRRKRQPRPCVHSVGWTKRRQSDGTLHGLSPVGDNAVGQPW